MIKIINLYFEKTEVRRELQALLQRLKQEGRSAPLQRKPVGFQNIALIPFTDAQVSK